MKRFILSSIIVCSVFVLLPLHAYSASSFVSAATPEAIFEIAKGFGSAKIGKDNDGDPQITGRINGVKYSVMFFREKGNTELRFIRLSSVWTEVQMTLEKINTWNQKSLFGTAYLDKDGDVVLDIVIYLKEPIPAQALEDWFTVWSTILQNFKETLNE